MKTDYEKIAEKLHAVGAVLMEEMTNETDELQPDKFLELWNVCGSALIVIAHDDGDCGLYHFVGENGDPVENDLEFIEQLARREK